MGAVVSFDLEKVKLKRANQRARQNSGYEREHVDHFAALQAQFEASRDLDDSARIFCAVETYFGRDLPQAAAATANLHMSGWAAATALASLYLKHSLSLLHRAAALLPTGNNLGSRSPSCRTERAAETFGPPRTNL